jgi:hypothetical protein
MRFLQPSRLEYIQSKWRSKIDAPSEDDKNILILSLLLWGLYNIPLIVFQIQYGLEKMPACAKDFDGISFRYNTYLFVSGVVEGSIMFVYMLSALLEAYLWVAVLTVFTFFYKIAWMIIGTILLFIELGDSSCSNSEPLWIFGIVLFSLQVGQGLFAMFVQRLAP